MISAKRSSEAVPCAGSPHEKPGRLLSLTKFVWLVAAVAGLLAPRPVQFVLAVACLLFAVVRVIKYPRPETVPKAVVRVTNKAPRQVLFIAALFLNANIRDVVLGDMEEIYQKDCKRLRSTRMATCLMCKDIFLSLYPLFKYFLWRASLRAFKAIGLYELYRRFIG